MALFRYKGKNLRGQTRFGFISTKDKKECNIELDLMGIRERSVTYVGNYGKIEDVLFRTVKKKRISKSNMVNLFEQLAFLLKSGVPQYKAIEIMGESENLEIAMVATMMKPWMLEGASLDGAMGKTKMFDRTTLAKIAAGSSSGTIEDTLSRISETLREEVELRAKVISSLTYPAFMLVMLVVVLVVMLAFIVPSIAGTIVTLGGELPALTAGVIAASDAVVNWWWLGVIIIVAIVVIHSYFYIKIDDYKLIVDSAKLKIPVLGKLMLKLEIVSICNMMNQLLESGVNTSTTLNITKTTINNERVRRAMNQISKEVEFEGADLYVAFNKHKVFPMNMLQLIMVGVNTGNIVEVLGSLNSQYSTEIQRDLAKAVSMIEPISIMLTAAIGGLIVISLYLPMFSVVSMF